MSLVNDKQVRRQATNPNDKQEKSGLFSSLINSFTRSKTPKAEDIRSANQSIISANKSAVIQKQNKQAVNPTQQIFIKPKTIQNNSDFQFQDRHYNKDLSNHTIQNASLVKSNVIMTVTPNLKAFEPYSQQSTLIDFLKREHIDGNSIANNNKENKSKNNQNEQINQELKNSKVGKETLSLRHFKGINEESEDQKKKKSKSQMVLNDVSSRDMLADQTMVLESAANRQNNDAKIQPVLHADTLESEVWSDECDKSNNIGYYQQTDEENRQRQNVVNGQLDISFTYKTNITENTKSNGKTSPQDSNENQYNSNQNNQIDTINQQDDIIAKSYEEEEDECVSQGSLPKESSNSNGSRESQQQNQMYSIFNRTNNNGKQPHLLQNIPLYLSQEKRIQNLIPKQDQNKFMNAEIINESNTSSRLFMKTKVEDKVEQEITLKNKSQIEGVKKVYDIKVLLTDDNTVTQKQASILIDSPSFYNDQLTCSLYNANSQHIPQFYFTDLSITSIKLQIQKDILTNVYKLSDETNNTNYSFIRFQNLQGCSFFFQDIILQQFISSHVQSHSSNNNTKKKKIYLFEHQNNDIYLLRESEEYITLNELITLSSQSSFGFKKLKYEQIFTIFEDILSIYNVFDKEKIALPDLSPDTIVINYTSLAFSFINLSNCYPLEDFSQNSIHQLRKREREQIVNIFQSLKKNLIINQTKLGVGSSTLLPTQTDQDEDNLDEFLKSLFSQIINGDIEEALKSVKNQNSRINNVYNKSIVTQDDIITQNKSLLLQNASFLAKQIQQSTTYKQSIEFSDKKQQYDFKKKRQFLSQFLAAHENLIRTKKIRQESHNFFKCQKLGLLYEIYNSIFMKKESIKVLEDLKNLKGECYGVDSIEYLKTLQSLCKVYYQQRMFNVLLLHIEPYTDYLRNSLAPSNANELYQMCKLKLKIPKSPSVRQDILALIQFLQTEKNDSSDKKLQLARNENRYIFNTCKLYYQLACSFNQIDEMDQALENFKKCLAEISISSVEEDKIYSKIKFYSMSNIARIYFRQKNHEEAKTILRNLEQSTLKFAYPVYYQYLGLIEFEDKNYQLAHQYLHQCYILKENDSKCNRDYLELLLHYILVSFKQFGSSSDAFKKLCTELKNFTGDYYNLDCLLMIANLLLEERQYDLAFQKLEQVKGILNLLIFSERNNKQLFKEYKKRMITLEQKLMKVSSSH